MAAAVFGLTQLQQAVPGNAAAHGLTACHDYGCTPTPRPSRTRPPKTTAPPTGSQPPHTTPPGTSPSCGPDAPCGLPMTGAFPGVAWGMFGSGAGLVALGLILAALNQRRRLRHTPRHMRA